METLALKGVGALLAMGGKAAAALEDADTEGFPVPLGGFTLKGLHALLAMGRKAAPEVEDAGFAPGTVAVALTAVGALLGMGGNASPDLEDTGFGSFTVSMEALTLKEVGALLAIVG